MIRQHSQQIRQPERPETVLGAALREAMERANKSTKEPTNA